MEFAEIHFESKYLDKNYFVKKRKKTMVEGLFCMHYNW